ncbi:hypothetical protein XAUB_17000 [Xanthomonas citri pv. aurantifolii str. ICPB 11122]|nr:hypothetical protein XAUB_17000 [Xanthomonas citri pv. aurantifolii str. ICPB 11122]
MGDGKAGQMAAQGALDQRAVFAGQQPAQLRLLQPVRTLRVSARVGAERDVCSNALRMQLQQQLPHLRVGGLRAQTQIQRQIQRTFHHQGHARDGKNLRQGSHAGGAFDHRHDADVRIGLRDVGGQIDVAEAGDTSAGDTAPAQRRETRRSDGVSDLPRRLGARNHDPARAGIQYPANQFFVHLRHAHPGFAAGQLTGTDGMLQFVGRAQHMFQIQHHEAIAETAQQLAELHAWQCIEDADCNRHRRGRQVNGRSSCA